MNKTVGLIGLMLVLGASLAWAELCPRCKDGMYILSIGQCAECKNHTSSGAFKLCGSCSTKLGQCEHCRRPLKAQKTDKPAETNAPSSKASH